MPLARTFPRDRRAMAIMIALSVLFFAFYMILDLREGGRSTNLLTHQLGTPQFYIEAFGAWFFYGAVILNAALAFASSMLIVASFEKFQSRRAKNGALCSIGATLVFGFAVFGCPGCIMPLFGTLGLAVFANSLPLFGLEFKLLSLVIILATLIWVLRRDVIDDDGER